MPGRTAAGLTTLRSALSGQYANHEESTIFGPELLFDGLRTLSLSIEVALNHGFQLRG
jgi:hypothetical protein